jgi:hypothetical protein
VTRSRRDRQDPRQDPRQDQGQITLLVLVYALIVLAVLFTAASATAVHLARHRLLAVADGAALDAANALDRQRFYAEVGGAGPAPDRVISLSAASVQASVQAYLLASPQAGHLDQAVVAEPTGSPDGSTAEVTLTTVARVPLLSTVTGDRAGGVTVRVTARARARQLG